MVISGIGNLGILILFRNIYTSFLAKTTIVKKQILENRLGILLVQWSSKECMLEMWLYEEEILGNKVLNPMH